MAQIESLEVDTVSDLRMGLTPATTAVITIVDRIVVNRCSLQAEKALFGGHFPDSVLGDPIEPIPVDAEEVGVSSDEWDGVGRRSSECC